VKQYIRMVVKVTNFPKFLREIKLYGISNITQMEERILDKLPADLEEFFNGNPEICDNNLDFTNTPHTPLKREGVLFITQRRQATSDIRENPKVQLLGSHAAMTCQIVLMRHTESNVASIGHFDNFSCWQFGDEASAHKEGLKVMMEEIEFLSKEDLDEGHIQVSVFGGYTDERDSSLLCWSIQHLQGQGGQEHSHTHRDRYGPAISGDLPSFFSLE